MTTGNKILIVAGGGLVLVLLVIFIALPLFRTNDEDPVQTITQPVTTDPSSLTPLVADTDPTEPTETVVNLVTDEPTQMTESEQRAEIERLTRLFAERYGSYSNFSNFENLRSIKGLMTPSLQLSTEAFIEANSSSTRANYLGVSSRVITYTLSDFTSTDSAKVMITLQEEVQDGISAPIEKSYRDMELDVIFDENRWLVTSVKYLN